MGHSLNYNARRDNPLTEDESEECKKFIKLYCDRFPLKGEAEEFCVKSGDDERSVFCGSTEIPDYSDEAFFVALQHWVCLLYEIHRIIDDCEWSVTLDDKEMIWTKEGWRFPQE